MRSYLFAFNSDQLSCLEEKGLLCARYGNRYVVDEESFEGVLECMGWCREDIDVSSTDTDGLYSVDKHPDAMSDLVNINSRQWDGCDNTRYLNNFANAFENLARKVEKKITISVPHGHYQEYPENARNFHVYVWSSPTNFRGVSTPSELFGFSGHVIDSSFSPTGLGVSIMCGDYSVAELFPNALYIHFDVCHRGTSEELSIIQKIAELATEKYDDLQEIDYTKGVYCNNTTPLYEQIKDLFVKNRYSEILERPIIITDNPLTQRNSIFVNPLVINFGRYEDRELINIESSSIMGYKKQPNNKLMMHSAIFDFAIKDDLADRIVAECRDNVLDILIMGITTKQKNMVKKIFESYLTYINLNDDERVAYDDTISKIVADGSTETFIKILTDSRMDMLKKEEQELSRMRSDIAEYQNKIVNMTRRMSQSMVSIEALAKDSDWVKTKVSRELSAIRRNKNVLKVEVVGEKLHVLTKIIYCKHPKTKNIHEIGAFNITLNLKNNGDLFVKYNNLSHKINGYQSDMHAPHVFSDGRPCLGNIGETLPSLIANCEYSVALDLCIQFLQSVNLSDVAGKYIDKWPIKEQAPETTVSGTGEVTV
jgi:hypothetical protein